MLSILLEPFQAIGAGCCQIVLCLLAVVHIFRRAAALFRAADMRSSGGRPLRERATHLLPISATAEGGHRDQCSRRTLLRDFPRARPIAVSAAHQ